MTFHAELEIWELQETTTTAMRMWQKKDPSNEQNNSLARTF